MPYSNIVFIKLYLDLLDGDDRFLYQLNERQQLLYLKTLVLAGKTGNKIPIHYKFIADKVGYLSSSTTFFSDIEVIKRVYPKFKEYKGLYYFFENFNSLHNLVSGTPKETPRNSKGIDQRIDKENREEYIYIGSSQFLIVRKSFLENTKKNYDYLDLDVEFKKMEGWLLTHQIRAKQIKNWERFIINWLNKLDKPVPTPKKKPNEGFFTAPDEKGRFKGEPPKEFKNLVKKITNKG